MIEIALQVFGYLTIAVAIGLSCAILLLNKPQ